MKWNRLFRKGRRQEGSETEQTLFEDDAVHKKSKHQVQYGAEQDDQQHPFLHEHQHADDRTEGTQTSCNSINITCITMDSPTKPKALVLASTNTVPLHIIENHNCNSMLESPRSGPVVKFSTVEMRHYQRIVGDHPDVETPLAIGWEFVQGPPVSVNDLEEQKAARKIDCERDLRLPFTTTHGKVVTTGLLEPSRLSSYPTSPKMLQRAAAFSESVRAGLLTHSNPWTAQHKNSSDEIANKYLEPISLKERIFLLQIVGGYSLEQIHQAERRRRVQIVLEWAYR